MWENMVGRGRAFCSVLGADGRRASSAARRPTSTRDALYRAVNRVTPSFIRVEADEVTYGLHIILRFELEQELIEGRLDGRRPARGLERALQGVPRDSTCPTTPTACSRTCTGRRA